MRRGRFRWTTFGAAMAASLAWHLGYVIPQVFAPLMEKPEAPLEVAYEPDLPGPDDKSPDDKAPEPQPDKPDPQARREPKAEPPKPPDAKPEAKPPEVAQVEPPKPVAKVEPPKPAQPLPPPPPPPPLLDHRKQMVDQSRFPDEEDNPDAKYLSQTNHKTLKETRDSNTNLVREVHTNKPAASEENANQSQDVGGKDDKIAELENHAGPDKTIPRSSPMHGDEGTRTQEVQRGPLAMRDLTPRAAEPVRGEKPRDGLEQQEPGAGDLPMARVGRDERRASTGGAKKGGVNLQLDHHMYDAIEGYSTAEKERQAGARAEQSHHKGRYDKYLASAQAMRSSLENFTFDVKPGNQAELGTRRSPFAAYITAMHRQIHKFWTFGFLADLDARPNSLYANDELWTQLEIVLKADGTVDKVAIVHSSGVLPFDVVAIDSVMSAAPFPVPPAVIKSANGKVYMDWQFHRDERACGTFGVDPHILTTPGAPVEHDTSETGVASHALLKRQGEGPRTLSRGTASSSHGGGEEGEAPAHAAATAPPAGVVPEVTPEARNAAVSWFDAYTRGDAGWLAGWSAAPFVASGEVVAKDGPAVKKMYAQLLAEAPASRAHGAVEVLTPAGVRGRLGGLPPGGEESGMLYAIGKIGGDELILFLKQSSQGWRVSGLAR